MALTVFTILVATPFMFAIVKFESNCHNRTLVNRIMGFMFALMIIWNFTVNLPSLIRYVSGPFPVLFCQLEYLNKNAMTLILAIFADFALIIRYIFVIKSKNPTAVQDEFWMFFFPCFHQVYRRFFRTYPYLMKYFRNHIKEDNMDVFILFRIQ